MPLNLKAAVVHEEDYASTKDEDDAEFVDVAWAYAPPSHARARGKIQRSPFPFALDRT